jgi:hypothetical protein
MRDYVYRGRLVALPSPHHRRPSPRQQRGGLPFDGQRSDRACGRDRRRPFRRRRLGDLPSALAGLRGPAAAVSVWPAPRPPRLSSDWRIRRISASRSATTGSATARKRAEACKPPHTNMIVVGPALCDLPSLEWRNGRQEALLGDQICALISSRGCRAGMTKVNTVRFESEVADNVPRWASAI